MCSEHHKMRQPGITPSLFLEFAGFRMDLRDECLWRGGAMIRLQRKTFAILRYLAEHPNRLVRKDELLRELWGSLHVTESVLKTHMSRIRGALRDSARRPSVIETLHGRGYRFIPKVRLIEAVDAAPRAESHSATRSLAEPWVEGVSP